MLNFNTLQSFSKTAVIVSKQSVSHADGMKIWIDSFACRRHSFFPTRQGAGWWWCQH